MAIKCIVHTVSSKRDVNGNRYRLARFYNTAKSRSEFVQLEVGGESNARSIARRLAGDDFESMLAIETEVSKREWQSMNALGKSLYEGSQEATVALRHLFMEAK